MANRRLIALQVDGQTSTRGNHNSIQTDSWVTIPLFDSTALEASGSASTKTITPKPARPVISARQRAKDAARNRILRDKLGSGYLPLVCGHFTDYETQRQFYKQYAVRGKYFCDTCQGWKRRAPKARYDPIPDEPPF